MGKSINICLKKKTCVGQGDVLSRLFFNIVIDYIVGKLQQVEGGLRRTEVNILKGMVYADYICLFAEDVDSIIALTDILNVEAKQVGPKHKYSENHDNEGNGDYWKDRCSGEPGT